MELYKKQDYNFQNTPEISVKIRILEEILQESKYSVIVP